METNGNFFALFDETHLLPDWKSLIGSERTAQLQEAGLLKQIPIKSLIGFRSKINFGNGANFFELREVNNKTYFVPCDFSGEPIEITAEEHFTFAKLDSDIYFNFLRKKNGLEVCDHDMALPSEVKYLGSKSSGSKVIHFLCKQVINEWEVDTLKKFILSNEEGKYVFVFLTGTPHPLTLNLGRNRLKNSSIAKLPTPEESFLVQQDMVYRSEFGYNFTTTVEQADLKTLVVGNMEGLVSFARQNILNRKGADQFILLSHLAKNPNQDISIDYLVEKVLLKDLARVNSSKIVGDLRHEILKKGKLLFQKDSELVEAFESLLPKKDRDQYTHTSLSTKKVSIIVFS